MAPLDSIYMKLLSPDEIKAGLDNEFLPLEPVLSGYRLIDKKFPNIYIEGLEKALSTKFPKEFREMIGRFDFGNLTVGPVAFCASGDYAEELSQLNTTEHWWGLRARPEDVVAIANSDPFTILMNANSGFIYAMDPERGWKEAKKISENFLKFFAGLGTAILLRNEMEDRDGFAKFISIEVGGEFPEYWKSLAV